VPLIITVKEKYIQILGITVTACFGIVIVFLYAAEPRSLEEAAFKARSAVENAVTKGQVITGTYQIDAALFEDGRAAFERDDFVQACDRFAKADPERRDARTQFYIAYSFYRQGFGRFSNDDALFRSGLEALTRVELIDANFTAPDPGLKLRTPAELRRELEDGLRLTASDLDPRRIFRERK
jgi:hypothetical protein